MLLNEYSVNQCKVCVSFLNAAQIHFGASGLILNVLTSTENMFTNVEYSETCEEAVYV